MKGITLSGHLGVDGVAFDLKHDVDAVLLAEVVGRLPNLLIHVVIDFGLALLELFTLDLDLDGQIGFGVVICSSMSL